MASQRSLSYRETGVLDNTQLGLSALLGWVNRTKAFRPAGRRGHGVLDVGFFASVVDLGNNLGLALCTDGVGSKVLVAEMLQRYDTIGIDCVAMNVNDAICVGAEPISFLDYIADRAGHAGDPRGDRQGAPRGGAAGRREPSSAGRSRSFPRSSRATGPGRASTWSGCAPGSCPWTGSSSAARSRRATSSSAFAAAGSTATGSRWPGARSSTRASSTRTRRFPGWAARLGDELLRPTHIYVRPVVELLANRDVAIRALVNITGDGFLNLARIEASRRVPARHPARAAADLRADPDGRERAGAGDVPRVQHGDRVLPDRRGRAGHAARGGRRVRHDTDSRPDPSGG